MKRLALPVLVTLMVGAMGVTVLGATPSPGQPVLITSSGQSMEVYTAKVLADRVGLKYTYKPHATVEDLANVKTLIVSVGASMKGFGAAGIDQNSELERTKKLISAAKSKGIYLLVLHIGGKDRRGPLSAPFVELVAPNADCLIVWKDGNSDGYFTKLSKENGIRLIELDTVLDLPNAYKAVFGL